MDDDDDEASELCQACVARLRAELQLAYYRIARFSGEVAT